MKRQISESEKAELITISRQQDGFIHCFIDNEKIENENEIQFDHIEPFAKIEDTAFSNIAPVCKNHNLAKKEMALSEYRDKLQMDNFFAKFESLRKPARLDDVLAFKYGKDFGFPVQYDFDTLKMRISLKYYHDKDKILPQKLNLISSISVQ